MWPKLRLVRLDHLKSNKLINCDIHSNKYWVINRLNLGHFGNPALGQKGTNPALGCFDNQLHWV